MLVTMHAAVGDENKAWESLAPGEASALERAGTSLALWCTQRAAQGPWMDRPSQALQEHRQ